MNAKSDRKNRLGKGLGALMGEIKREEPVATGRDTEEKSNSDTTAATARVGLLDVPVGAVSPLPGQPRTHFDEDSLDQLAKSIEQRGVIQPIIVTELGHGKYRLVAGERRWRAAQRARLHTIPAIVRELEQRDVMALALIENLQREDLNPLEEARAYQKLSDEEGMTQADIAELVDKSRSHVANYQRLLALPDDVLAFVAQGILSMGHAKPLIGNENAVEIARKAVNDNLSVREVERLARGATAKRQSKPKATAVIDPADNADIAAVQNHLEEFLGLPVKIRTEGAPGNGTVTIGYRTLDQLDLICQRLTGGDL